MDQTNNSELTSTWENLLFLLKLYTPYKILER